MPLTAFIVRPFGLKDFMLKPDQAKKLTLPMKNDWQPPAPADKPELLPSRKTAYEVCALAEDIMKVWLDFDWVQAELLKPALDDLRLNFYTTEAFAEAGNIREDMFRELLTADLVIADVSIYNPNVYYELGIRHAFRDKHTFMLCCEASEQPFDLRTDRYFKYDWQKPGKEGDKERLIKAIQSTIKSDRGDSPVFRLMPRLEAVDRSRFISVPPDFREEVECATKQRRGGDLRLLAHEATDFLWEIEGLRLVGRAQFELNYLPGAKATWEAILNRYPDDVEANTVLSTIYQRLNDDTRSDQAIQRVSKLNSLSVGRRAEVRGLSGRNLKARWVASWKNDEEVEEAIKYLSAKKKQKEGAAADILKQEQEKSDEQKGGNKSGAKQAGKAGLEMLKRELKELLLVKDETCLSRGELATWKELLNVLNLTLGHKPDLDNENLESLLSALTEKKGKEKKGLLEQLKKQAWAKRALRSPLLQRAYESYEQAFMADLNYPYAGLNALALLLIQVDLAERYDKVWESLQVKPHDALRELGWRRERIKRLTSAIDISLEAERLRLRQEGRVDFWFEVVEAGFHCLTSDRPEMVAQAYADALIWAPPYAGAQMRKALQLYEDLGIHELRKPASRQVSLVANLVHALDVIKDDTRKKSKGAAQHILLFAGLRVDPLPQTQAAKNGTSKPETKRFPREAETSQRAKEKIHEAVKKERQEVKDQNGEILCAMAGGSSGGDLLFHQVCTEENIPLCLFLALPKEQHVGKYVAPAGEHWVKDFRKAYQRQKENAEKIAKLNLGNTQAINIMTESPELPRWLTGKQFYNVGRRSNLWMLQNALIAATLFDAELTLIVLWDSDTRQGVGGIGDMIRLAEKNGIRVIKLEGWNSPSSLLPISDEDQTHSIVPSIPVNGAQPAQNAITRSPVSPAA